MEEKVMAFVKGCHFGNYHSLCFLRRYLGINVMCSVATVLPCFSQDSSEMFGSAQCYDRLTVEILTPLSVQSSVDSS